MFLLQLDVVSFLILIFLLIVSIKEGEVLIQRFGTVKNLKIIFSDYKAIEFIAGKRLCICNLGEEFVKITKGCFPAGKCTS